MFGSLAYFIFISLVASGSALKNNPNLIPFTVTASVSDLSAVTLNKACSYLPETNGSALNHNLIIIYYIYIYTKQ